MERVTCPNCHNRIPVKIIPLSNSFEQTVPIGINTNGLDAINFSITALFAGVVVFVFTWWYEVALAGILVSATLLGTGIGLHVFKMWLTRPAQRKEEKIRVEHIDESGKHWLIDELNCNVELDKIRSVARLLANENWQWSMRLTTGCGLSQTKHHQLKDNLLKLNYLRPLPNNRNGYEVTGRGRRVFMSLLGRT